METAELIRQWRTAVRVSHRAHADAAARWERAGRLVGVPAIGLASLVGTVILATIEASPGRTARAFAGLAAVAAAALVSLQTFLGHSDRAQRHREAALRYAWLRRELDDLAAGGERDAKAKRRLEDIRARWAEVDAMAPAIPARQLARARDLVLGTRES
ncbi:MAG TPA: SLATT domain-containing protein [Egibacteraceae bacterium]|nr:SLATT domain-containing protein [Egibacteraceae bacterium]